MIQTLYDDLGSRSNKQDEDSDGSEFSDPDGKRNHPYAWSCDDKEGTSVNPISLDHEDVRKASGLDHSHNRNTHIYEDIMPLGIGGVGELSPEDVTHMFEKISPDDLTIMLEKRGPDGYVSLDVICQLVDLKKGFDDPSEVARVIQKHYGEYQDWHKAFVKRESEKTKLLFETRQIRPPNFLKPEGNNQTKKRAVKGVQTPTKKRARATATGKSTTQKAATSKALVLRQTADKSIPQTPSSNTKSRPIKSCCQGVRPVMKYATKARELMPMFGMLLVLEGEENIMAKNDYFVRLVRTHPAFVHDSKLTHIDRVSTNKYPGCICCAYSVIRNEWNVMKPNTTLTEIKITNTHRRRDGQKCRDHPNGCGRQLKLNDMVCTMGDDTHLVGGEVYYIGVYLVLSKNKTGCKVGVVKAAYHQLQYFTNRIGFIKFMNKGDDPTKQRGIENGVRGWATMSCTDEDYNFKLNEEKGAK